MMSPRSHNNGLDNFWFCQSRRISHIVIDPVGHLNWMQPRTSQKLLLPPTFLKILRIILPDLVLGNPGTHRMTSGVAMGPIDFLTSCLIIRVDTDIEST